jgi:rare lipoprotein A
VSPFASPLAKRKATHTDFEEQPYDVPWPEPKDPVWSRGEQEGVDMTQSETLFKQLALAIITYALALAAFGENPVRTQEGVASYYADALDGNTTASGEPYDKNAMTAAHRELPLGAKVRVTYKKTGKSVTVTINDRGPHAKNRIIDVSGAAARKLGMVEDGHGPVVLEVLAE